MRRKRSYAELLSQSELLVKAILANQGGLPAKIDADFATALRGEIEEVARLNVLQEKLKSDLKEVTANVEESMAQIRKRYAEAKKRIKLDFPQERWIEFGFADKR